MSTLRGCGVPQMCSEVSVPPSASLLLKESSNSSLQHISPGNYTVFTAVRLFWIVVSTDYPQMRFVVTIWFHLVGEVREADARHKQEEEERGRRADAVRASASSAPGSKREHVVVGPQAP